MADRYQDRPNPAHDDYGRGSDPHAANRAESDPLAELARLIGQTDPFAMGRANAKVQPRAEPRPQVQQYQPPAEIEDVLLRHACVADAAVVGVPDAEWGQRIEAVCVLRPGVDVESEELRAHLILEKAGDHAVQRVRLRKV